jgi:hypothetical protein
MALLKRDRAAEACPKLAASQRLDPGMATQFRLAECYEKIGQTATAYALFLEVADAARAAKSQEREEFARKRAVMLEPRLTKLILAVPPELRSLEGFSLIRDGAVVDRFSWGAPVPIDPGEHIIEAAAPGRQSWRTKIHVDAKPGVTVRDIPMLEPSKPASAMELRAPVVQKGDGEATRRASPAAANAAPWSMQRQVGVALGAIGLGGLVVGSVFGIQTFAKTGAARCSNTDPPMCDAAGLQLQQEANTTANVANVAFAVGGAALIGGLVLFVTAPATKAKPETPSRVWVGPYVGLQTTALSVRGEW